jgi:mRNA degradation ribonuclease J1/J2
MLWDWQDHSSIIVYTGHPGREKLERIRIADVCSRDNEQILSGRVVIAVQQPIPNRDVAKYCNN